MLLAIITLAPHPHVVGHAAPQAELRELGTLGAPGRLGARNVASPGRCAAHRIREVHFVGGLTRQPVVSGLVSFAIGICGLLAAGLIDGFILPELAARFVAASPASQVGGYDAHSLLCGRQRADRMRNYRHGGRD